MKYKAGFIGCGNMGGALAKAVASAVGGSSVALFDVDGAKSAALAGALGAVATDDADVYRNSEFVFFAVKPNIISKVLASASSKLSKNAVAVSMAAGVSVRDVMSALGSDRVIRIMPNTPAAVGAGVILYTCAEGIKDGDVSSFLQVMSRAGIVDAIDEKYIDAAAALSGCGPAFAYMFIEGLADGAVACGLPRDKALLYAKQTLLGSASLALASDKHPEKLKDEVCSPGGTTIEGVLALERGSFRSDAASAVIAAFEKTKKLK